MRGLKLAIVIGILAMAATVAISTSASAQTGVPDWVDECLAADDIGACFAEQFSETGTIPDFVQTCLSASDVGACFAAHFSSPPPPPPTTGGIPAWVAQCLAIANPLDRAACFAKHGGG
jgi:hypothetical protein